MPEHPFTAFRKNQNPEMTQAGLGRLLGRSRSYILRVESGERKVGVDLLPVVRDRLGISPKDIRPDLADALEAAE